MNDRYLAIRLILRFGPVGAIGVNRLFDGALAKGAQP